MAKGSLVFVEGEAEAPTLGNIASVAVDVPNNGTGQMFAQSQRIGFSCNGGAITVWGEVQPDTGSGQTITAWASDGVNTISNPDLMFVTAPFSLVVSVFNDDLGPGGATRSFVQVNIQSGGTGGISLQVTNPPGVQLPLPALVGPFGNPFMGGRQSGEGVAFDDFSAGDFFAALFDHFDRPNGPLGISDCGAPWVALSPLGVPGSATAGAVFGHEGLVQAGGSSDLNVTMLSSGFLGGPSGPILTGAGRT